MSVDAYAERLARVRQRFVSALESKIGDSYAAIPELSGETAAATEAVGETYRRMHGIVGIGPTVGFASTGRQRVLDVTPDELHQRVAFIFGAREEVERIEQYYRDYNVAEYDTPLFSTRGLFRTNG